MIYLDLEDLLHVARRTLGKVQVRDIGLLESAAARTRATAFGEDAYASVHDKAAALLHSLARTQPLVDGNKRLGLAATIAFLGMNGLRLTLSNDEAYDLVMAVATGELDDVGAIAQRLKAGRAPSRGSVISSAIKREQRRELAAPDAAILAATGGDDDLHDIAQHTARTSLDDLD